MGRFVRARARKDDRKQEGAGQSARRHSLSLYGADAREFIGGVLAAKDVFAFAVFADGLFCGSISVTRGGNVHRRTGELGYYLAEPFWGRGIGRAAVKKMCAFVFENSDIVRIFAEPFSQNAASCRVLEKCGFSCEGILRKNAEKNGKLLDMKMYTGRE